MDNAIVGVRKAESTKRAKRYQEPTKCRIYRKGEHVNQIYPILEWTDEDVKNFISDRGIKCHPLYYDEAGYFHVERRLGCIGCPLAHNAKNHFKKYPKMVRAYINAAKVFMQNRKQKELNVYEWFYARYFLSRAEDFHKFTAQRKGDNLFGDKPDIKRFLEEYYNIEL